MGEKFNSKVEGLYELPPPPYTAVGLAVSGSEKSKTVIKWALEIFVPEGVVHFKLLHVRPVVSRIPTPMGNYIQISQVRDDVAAAFRKEIQSQVSEKLLHFKKMFDQKRVHVEIVQIEYNDVVTAISANIQKHRIDRLVIGASSRSIFSRTRTLSSKISESCPSFCTVYVVSKGKLSSLRPSDSEGNISFRDDSSETTCSSSDNNSSSYTSSSRTDCTTDQDSFAHFRTASLPVQRFQALSNMNQTLHKKMPSTVIAPHSRNLTLDNVADNFPIGSDVIYYTTAKNFNSFTSSSADNNNNNPSSDQASTSDNTPTKNQADVNFELEKMRVELRHIRGMYAMAQGEAIDTSRKLSELQKRRLEEETNLRQISFKEKEAKELADKEKTRYEDARREADLVNECAERETKERRDAEIWAARETKEKENLENALNGSSNHYRKFTWEEIVDATSSFSDDRKIGMGAYGTVYRSTFHHTTAAVKILHSKDAGRNKQFQQEVDILSKIRHPHLLILIGACIDHSCLVYEFMENGSLEDRLIRETNKKNAPPLLWFDRFRIAWEVASALSFLHNAKPKGIVHRDLKPANILLDINNVSKIGDVGLSTVVNKDSISVSSLVGTLSYIDPEYQRTGVVAPESDVYAFGMVVLQLITGKPAIALTHKVEMAVANDRLTELLDKKGGDWPIEETKCLALMALKCTELRRIDRPEMKGEVLPVLERLKDFAEKTRNVALVSAPKQFICPISNVVMSDPCVAGDGYTYDRGAIEEWIKAKDTSPVTDLQLPHKYLIPNYTLLSAIMEWKS
ncbi:hypothetical protein ACP275_06G051500 [Erythranthe tilingii]